LASDLFWSAEGDELAVGEIGEGKMTTPNQTVQRTGASRLARRRIERDRRLAPVADLDRWAS
jgi:hypothetical protein